MGQLGIKRLLQFRQLALPSSLNESEKEIRIFSKCVSRYSYETFRDLEMRNVKKRRSCCKRQRSFDVL